MVEINIFKRLDLLNREPVEPWTEVYNIVQEEMSKTIPKKKRYKTTWLSENALQIVEEIREEKAREKAKYPTKCRVPKNSMERQEGLLH